MTESQELNVKRPIYSRIMKVYRRWGRSIPFFKTVVRTSLQLKIAMDRSRVSLFCHGKETEIRDWFDETRLFFGFAIYRSGTAFLATFLNQVIDRAVIEHEANVDDYWYYHLALRSEIEAEKYITSFRLPEIYYRVHRSRLGLYGEINPFLRRHCKALQKQLPQATFFHLVRDGRAVVRSLMSREILDKTDPLGDLTRPPPKDPYENRWGKMTRFEKICWLWQCDNRYLRENIGVTLQFEKLLSDYDYFRVNLADLIGVHVPEATWQRYTPLTGNPTPFFRMGNWEQWNDADREAFRTICGTEMRACGYDFE